jgi:Domain of unknown function (DUF5679)
VARTRRADSSTEIGAAADDPKRARKRLKRLERELARLWATEAKRREQLKAVHAKTADVSARLIALRVLVAETQRGRAEAGNEGPIGFCLREKRPVPIHDPLPVTLSNGRAAIAGTCATCGSRVMVLSGRTVPIDA